MWYFTDDMHSTMANEAKAIEVPSISSCRGQRTSQPSRTHVDELEDRGGLDLKVLALDLLARLVECLLDHLALVVLVRPECLDEPGDILLEHARQRTARSGLGLAAGARWRRVGAPCRQRCGRGEERNVGSNLAVIWIDSLEGAGRGGR